MGRDGAIGAYRRRGQRDCGADRACASGKEKVAFCGYHGWHDWYLSANIGADESLDGHLMPGLEPNGVPRSLQGTTAPFEYNDIDALKRILAAGDVGVICMEVSRNFGPRDGFLQEVRRLATAHGAVLMFDECTSGFRQTFGGLHKHFGVEPDIAMFGKALATDTESLQSLDVAP